MNMTRFWKHLVTTHLHTRAIFPPESRRRIAAKIAEEERQHSGEIVFVVEPHLEPLALLRGMSARQRAIDLFSSLRVWDTEHNCGVLIYLLLAERRIEIVADRGVDAHVGAKAWEKLCAAMGRDFAQGRFEEGVFAVIEEVSSHLKTHFPRREDDRNELPDEPVVL